MLLAVVVALFGAISLLSQPKEISYALSYEFSVRDPAFLPSAHALADPIPVEGNRIDLLINGDRIYPAMLEAIKAAKQTINLESYIFWSGKVGHRFVDALANASRRNVQVRVLLDGIGTGSKLTPPDARELTQAGCHLELYHPIRPWMLDVINNRTHRRLLIVDGRIGFTGGAGIADIWDGNADSPEHWRDTHVRVQGPVVAQLQSAFQETWGEAHGEVLTGDRFYPKLEPAGTTKALVLSSTRRAASSATKLLYAVSIAAATNRILLANSYFVPDRDSIRLFSEAARRGVDVRILVPGKVNDVPATKAAGKSGFGQLLKAGIRIYEYRPTMLHAKTMVVDGLFATVGSTNFDNRSFRLNEELNLTIYDEAFAKQLEATFWADLARSRPYTLQDWTERSARERFLEWIIGPVRSQL